MHGGGKTVCVFSSPLPTVTMLLWFRPSYGFSWLMCVDFLIACADYKWYRWMCHLNFILTFHILRHVCICLCMYYLYFWVGGNYGFNLSLISFVVVQSLSHVRLFASPWTAAHQASLLHHLLEVAQIHIHWVGDAIQPSHPLLPPSLLPSVVPSIRVFSNEVALRIKEPKYWSFSTSPSNEYSGLISFRTDWFVLLVSMGLSRVFSSITVQKHQFFQAQPSLWSNSHILTLLLEKP